MRKTVLVDDLDGTGNDVEGVTFALGRTRYRIDLSAKNRRRLERALAPFIEVAEEDSTASKPGSSPKQAEHNRRVRAWARSNGWPELSDIGIIPKKIRAAYDDAHGVKAA